METYLRSEELRFEFRVTTVRRNNSNLHITKFKLHIFLVEGQHLTNILQKSYILFHYLNELFKLTYCLIGS